MADRLARVIALMALGLMLSACGSFARVGGAGAGSAVPVKTIAMMPGGGLMADAVAVELANRGLVIVDSASTTSLMKRINLKEVEVSLPEGLAKFRLQGVDAVLMVRAAADKAGEPQSVSARMMSTHTNALIAGVTWQNGREGWVSDVAGLPLKKGLSEAAVQIADELAARMKPAT